MISKIDSPKKLETSDLNRRLRQLGKPHFQSYLRFLTLGNARRVWSEFGYWRAIKRVRRSNQNFDSYRRVDTSNTLSPSRLETDSSNKILSEIYGPVPEMTFHYVLERMEIDFSTYTFFDIGAGKGKALLLAARYPFKQIKGVEFASNLCDIAHKNVKAFRYSQQECFDLEVIHGDIAEVALPEGDTFYFLYAPFFGPILDSVLLDIKRSLEATPRRIIVCFVDNNVPDSLTQYVAGVIETWGSLQLVDLGAMPNDPQSFKPFIATAWTNHNTVYS